MELSLQTLDRRMILDHQGRFNIVTWTLKGENFLTWKQGRCDRRRSWWNLMPKKFPVPWLITWREYGNKEGRWSWVPWLNILVVTIDVPLPSEKATWGVAQRTVMEGNPPMDRTADMPRIILILWSYGCVWTLGQWWIAWLVGQGSERRKRERWT